jgi:ribosomal-protein-alanine N-acetyltransferase
LLAVRVPDDWPASDLRDFLPFYAQLLADDPSQLGWGIWLVIDVGEQTLIGDAGFKGGPGAEGTVEIGYGVLPAFRRCGYAFEAVQALVHWAFAQPNVRRVVAECLDDNIASIRILQKLGMQPRGHEGDLLRWELSKAAWSGGA